MSASEEKWLFKEGTSSKEFLHLEDLHLSKKEISKLYDMDGMVLLATDQILLRMKTFYENLYTPHTSKTKEEITNFLDTLHLPNVEDNLIFADKITEAEVLDAIQKLNTGKSPGPDGFTPDFYRKFALFVAHILSEVFNEIKSKGSLPYAFAQAIIVLFYKKGDALDLSNYQPISLTNFDYKILAYVLTNRLTPTFKNCIHPAQLAYLKGKFIGSNIQKVQDAMDCVKNNP